MKWHPTPRLAAIRGGEELVGCRVVPTSSWLVQLVPHWPSCTYPVHSPSCAHPAVPIWLLRIIFSKSSVPTWLHPPVCAQLANVSCSALTQLRPFICFHLVTSTQPHPLAGAHLATPSHLCRPSVGLVHTLCPCPPSTLSWLLRVIPFCSREHKTKFWF